MKNTAFFEIHKKLNAKIVRFAGFNMPIEYTSISDEHLAVRNKVGVFDVSHMGEIRVTGKQAIDLLQYVTTNDVSKLNSGKAQYTCMPNGKGGIVDDLLVYCIEPDDYLLVVNAANIEKDWNWINRQNSFGAKIENYSDNTVQLAVQGPLATESLQKLTNVNLSELKYYTFTTGQLAGVDSMIISATGYTGAGGFELYFHPKHAEDVWDAIFGAGKEFDIKPIGLGARDTLRLEMGYCLYGNDIDDNTSPIEAGLGWIVKFNKDENFINKDLFLKQKQEGVAKKLKAIELIDKGIARKDYKIVNSDNQIIGRVTSGSYSPVLKKGIAMGYVDTEYAKTDTTVFIKMRNRNAEAKIIKPPFLKK